MIILITLAVIGFLAILLGIYFVYDLITVKKQTGSLITGGTLVYNTDGTVTQSFTYPIDAPADKLELLSYLTKEIVRL
jgi:hypothetical protein